MAREEYHFEGEIYQIPYQGEDATGLGKPLKSILDKELEAPIYSASLLHRANYLCDKTG